MPAPMSSRLCCHIFSLKLTDFSIKFIDFFMKTFDAIESEFLIENLRSALVVCVSAVVGTSAISI